MDQHGTSPAVPEQRVSQDDQVFMGPSELGKTAGYQVLSGALGSTSRRMCQCRTHSSDAALGRPHSYAVSARHVTANTIYGCGEHQ
jgi:hypothetical protein